jgi:hypothetical protein
MMATSIMIATFLFVCQPIQDTIRCELSMYGVLEKEFGLSWPGVEVT